MKSKKPNPKKTVSDNSSRKAAELIKSIIEDQYLSTWTLFRINLLRGFAFGSGVFIGSTFLVVMSVWILGALSDIPLLGGLVDTIQETIDSR